MTDRPDSLETAADPLAGFDAAWYLRSYPDVALSGLEPGEHFLKFGRAMGRAPNAGGARGQTALPVHDPFPAAGEDDRIGADGPPPAAILLSDGTEIGRFHDADALQEAAGPLGTYWRMIAGARAPGTSLTLRQDGTDSAFDPVPAASGASVRPAVGGALLRTGALALETLSYVASTRLRIFAAGRSDADPEDQPDVLRLYQALPDTPEALRRIGTLALPETGPAFADVDLIHPLMPVLIEVADSGGRTRGWSLLPFPSLCPGGLHGAERTAAQLGWSPIEEVWRLSQAFLEEMLTDADPGFAIARLETDLAGATGAEPLLSRPVLDWMNAVFGLRPAPAAALDPAQEYLAESLGPARSRDGHLSLCLPAGMVPSLAVLVSRRLALPGEVTAAAGPFLIAEAVSHKPLWSVSRPLEEVFLGTGTDQPVLRRLDKATAPEQDVAAGHWIAPLHLGIVLRSTRPVDDIFHLVPMAPDQAPAIAGPRSRPDLSVIITVSDPALTARFLATLASQEGIGVADITLAPRTGIAAAALDEIRSIADSLFPGPCRILPERADDAVDLDTACDHIKADQLLIADEAVLLYCLDAVANLQDLLARDLQAASISPALLHEAVFKKGTRLQTASAGIFPGHVSFATAPRLGIVEPDALIALPHTTYPVIANGFALCLIRRDAIDSTRAARAGTFGAAPDLRFGLDTFAAGWRTLCSTTVRAGTTRAPSRRDQIDPMGLACLLPARWEDLLSRVTLLRELRG